MSHKVSRNVITLILSRTLAAVLVFAAYLSLFPYLGPEKTGQFQFVLAYVLLFSVAVDFGMEELVIKRVSEHKPLAAEYLGNFFAVEVYLAAFVYALLIAIALFNHYTVIIFDAILITGFGMFLNALTIPYTAILSAHEDMHLIAMVNFFDSVLNAAIIFITIWTHHSLVFLCSVQAVNGVMHLIVYRNVIGKYVERVTLWSYFKNIKWSIAKEMLLAAVPFGMLVGFSIVYNKIDVIILSTLKGYTETGLYTAAYKFMDLLSFFPAVISSSLYPFFSSQLKQNNNEAVRYVLEKYTKYLITIAMPLIVGGIILAPKLIITLTRSQAFYPAFPALQILVFATAILFIYSAVNSIMISQLASFAVWVSFSNIFINAIGNYLLIPHFGFKAAAVMTVVSECTQATLYFYFVRTKIINFSLFKYFPVPILAAIIMGFAIYHLRFHTLIYTIPLGIIVYLVIIFGTRYASISELKQIASRPE